jgi:hypothetical protein
MPIENPLALATFCNDTNYHNCQPYDHLLRAKHLLESDKSENLVYCALELRLLLEMRQNQFLHAQKDYLKAIPKTHKLANQNATLRKIYSGNQSQNIKITLDNSRFLEVQYIPIVKVLAEDIARLGYLLHCNKSHYSKMEFSEFKDKLMSLFSALFECLKGDLLSPVLFKPNSNEIIGNMSIVRPPNELTDLKAILVQGQKIKVEVTYSDIIY